MNKLTQKLKDLRATKKALGKKGFTLIELLIVIAIIGILVLLAVPSFLGYTKDAKVATMEADAKVLTNSALVYQVEEDAWPVSSEAETLEITALKAVVTDGQFFELDAGKVMTGVQTLKNKVSDYVLDTNTGKVYHKKGLENKASKVNFGHGVKAE